MTLAKLRVNFDIDFFLKRNSKHSHLVVHFYLQHSASNIATKTNAKLSFMIDMAVSWTSALDDVRGEFSGDDVIPWGKQVSL